MLWAVEGVCRHKDLPVIADDKSSSIKSEDLFQNATMILSCSGRALGPGPPLQRQEGWQSGVTFLSHRRVPGGLLSARSEAGTSPEP